MSLSVLRTASLVATLLWGSSVAAQSPFGASGTTYRVFLTTGEPLPSYGEPALVGDRVIFNLLLDDSTNGTSGMQLVSLPAAGIDTERTARYAHAMRASHYARTRGESDYMALTAEVARVLDDLTTVTDARRRLALAETARRGLLSWSADHYQYRAADIRALAGLFDEVIAALRIAEGRPDVSLDFVAGAPPLEPLLPEPTPRERVALALAAARTADIGTERVDILRRAVDVVDDVGDPAVERTVHAALTEEVSAGSAYAALIAALRVRAHAARQRGDVEAAQRLTQELERQDQRLGHRRPADVQALREQLAAAVASTRVFRRALDEHTRQLGALRRYDRQLRTLLLRFAGLEPVLTVLRNMDGVTPRQLAAAETELRRITLDVAAVSAPAPQVGVHATFQSALRMAEEACARRRKVTSSQAAEMLEASAAAAGALLLGRQVRDDLAASLRSPTIQ